MSDKDKPEKKLLWLRIKSFASKAIESQRFSWKLKLALILPFVVYTLLFKFSAYIPHADKPRIDTETLPQLESGLLFGYSLQKFPRSLYSAHEQDLYFLTILDLIAAGVYIVHFAFWCLYSAYLYYFYRYKCTTYIPILQPWTFFWCFGLLNLFAVLTQLTWPTAPPWYQELYGDKPANYSMEGYAAGLENVDDVLNVPLFEHIYESSPIVFGSFPSLHAAWPMLMCLFAPTKLLKCCLAVYTSLVWWAAVYLNHHYVVDVLGGVAYVCLAFAFGTYTAEVMLKLSNLGQQKPQFIPLEDMETNSGECKLEVNDDVNPESCFSPTIYPMSPKLKV